MGEAEQAPRHLCCSSLEAAARLSMRVPPHFNGNRMRGQRQW